MNAYGSATGPFLGANGELAGLVAASVFAISDGDDPDWASWYADWLANLSSLPDALGSRPVRSELTYLLVGLDKEYTRDGPADRWEDFYAARLYEHFATSS